MSKKYIILFSIMIIYFFILFIFFGLNNIKKEQSEAIIIVDTETVWKLEKNAWINITNSVSNELNEKIFTVFIDNEKIGNYYLERDNNWILYDTDRKQFNYDLGNFLAISSNYDISLLKFTSARATDRKYINKVLSENNIKDSQEFTVDNVYHIDFDSDGIIENFYMISNAFTKETSPSKVFSIAFMEKEGKIYYLYNSIDSNDGQNGCKPYLNAVVDLTQDNIYEIILSCGYYSMKQRHDMLYTYENNEFKLLLSNQ